MVLRKITFLFFTFIAVVSFLVPFSSIVYAQDVTSTPTPTPSAESEKQQDLENKIADLQNKIKESQGQQRTLSSQIGVMNNQITLTQLRIDATKQQIITISKDIAATNKKIENLEESLSKLTKILLNRIVVTYEVGTTQPFYALLSSSDVKDFFSRLNYLKVAQAHDKKLIYATEQAKNDYVTQRAIFEDKKKKVESLQKQLQNYTAQIAAEKQAKQTLLGVTLNDEKRYQTLLAEAQAQIKAFKSFASFQGGASILPPQPSPDGWYYNQRDERWGRSLIGSSGEQIWDVGCLVTSIAMVLKQSGNSLVPSDIAGNSSYFFSNTAYMLLPWGGGKFSSAWGFDKGSIDNRLAAGKPVIVGVKAGIYGMHFVVLKSGSNGDYIMNDPWNGPNLKFTDHYSTAQIFQYGFYNG